MASFRKALRVVLLFTVVLLLIFAAQTVLATNVVLLWRTRVCADGICGLSGRYLQLSQDARPVVQAWAGIRVDETGGHQIELIRSRHRQQLERHTAVWVRQLADAVTWQEMSARIRHTREMRPTYFDVVVVRFGDDCLEKIQVHIYNDDNLDGKLEHRGEVTFIASTDHDSANHCVADLVHMKLDGSDLTVAVTSKERFPQASFAEASRTARRPEADFPSELAALRDRLLRLDEPNVRKSNLPEIIEVADHLIHRLERLEGIHLVHLADVIYRKGRALGYRELPDVAARFPIQDQRGFDEEFETTFRRLQKFVDVTQPEYVLLAVRRERRRGNRGLAMDLLETYRRRHPSPVWYHRKQCDLMRELGFEDAAYQTAAEGWLRTAETQRPVPVIVRISTEDIAERSCINIVGSWTDNVPWRESRLALRRDCSNQAEAVVWLPFGGTWSVRGPSGDRQEFRTDQPFVSSGGILHLQWPAGELEETPGEPLSGTRSVK